METDKVEYGEINHETKDEARLMALSVRRKMQHGTGWTVHDDHDVIDQQREYVLWWSWLERGAFQLMWWKQRGRIRYRCTCQNPNHPMKGATFNGMGDHPDEAVKACLDQLHRTIAGLAGISQSINLRADFPGEPPHYPAVSAKLVPAGSRPIEGHQFIRLGTKLYWMQADGNQLKVMESALDGTVPQAIFTKGWENRDAPGEQDG